MQSCEAELVKLKRENQNTSRISFCFVAGSKQPHTDRPCNSKVVDLKALHHQEPHVNMDLILLELIDNSLVQSHHFMYITILCYCLPFVRCKETNLAPLKEATGNILW